MVLETMIETEDGSVPKTRDLERWADTYGLTMPVLADPSGGTMWSYAGGSGSVGLPFTVVIDRGVVIDSIATGSQESAVERRF